MRINQLPTLPAEAQQANVPCTYNGADYQTPMTVNVQQQFYQSGETINHTFFGYGFITTDSKQMTVAFPTPKPFQPGATLIVTSITASMRTVGGGYVGNAINKDFTGILSSATCDGSMLSIVLMSNTALTYGSGGTSRGVITNNTPVCGYITLQAIVE